MAIIREQIPIHKKWLWIKSNIPFKIENNYNDSIEKAPGTWRINTWELLPEQYHKNNPVFMLYISYDNAPEGVVNPFCTYSLTDIELSAIDSGDDSFKPSDLNETNTLIENVKDSVDNVKDSADNIKDFIDEQNSYISDISESILMLSKNTLKINGKHTNYGKIFVFTVTDFMSIFNKFVEDILKYRPEGINIKLKLKEIDFFKADNDNLNMSKIIYKVSDSEYYSGATGTSIIRYYNIYMEFNYHYNTADYSNDMPHIYGVYKTDNPNPGYFTTDLLNGIGGVVSQLLENASYLEFQLL